MRWVAGNSGVSCRARRGGPPRGGRCGRDSPRAGRTSCSSWPTISARPTWAATAAGTTRRPTSTGWRAEGMRFTDGYTCGPNCQPTRAALMSGQYGPRTGVYTVGGIDRFDRRSGPCGPSTTSRSCRWRRSPSPRRSSRPATRPACSASGTWAKTARIIRLAQGFDEAIVSGQAFQLQDRPPRPTFPPGTYLADFLTDKAVDFIERHKDQPFFLYLPHFAVHSPHQAKADHDRPVQGQAAGRRPRGPDLRRDDRQRRRERRPRRGEARRT